MKRYALLLAVVAISGCQTVIVNWKGSVANSNQESEDGANTTYTPTVPEHQQGSDTAVPILGKIKDLMKIEGDTALKALKECRKMADDGSLGCAGIQIPGLPNLNLRGIEGAGNDGGGLFDPGGIFGPSAPPDPATPTPLPANPPVPGTPLPPINPPLPVPQ